MNTPTLSLASTSLHFSVLLEVLQRKGLSREAALLEAAKRLLGPCGVKR